jgi:chorismate dehydratase
MSTSDLLRIVLWEDSRLHPFGAALGRDYTQVSFCSRVEAETRLLAGLCDLAVLPSDRVLSDLDAYDVLPAVAYSTWSTPHVQLALRDGFSGQPESVQCPDPAALESLIARIVLKEHYGTDARAETLVGPAGKSQAAAVLAVDESPPSSGSGRVLDIGQEWYELTNYPMVWGLFAMRKGEATAASIRLLREAAETLETADHLDGTDPEEDGFGLPRFRLDSVAIASLTELCDYLYYYGVTGDISELALAHIAEDVDTTDDMRDPLL